MVAFENGLLKAYPFGDLTSFNGWAVTIVVLYDATGSASPERLVFTCTNNTDGTAQYAVQSTDLTEGAPQYQVVAVQGGVTRRCQPDRFTIYAAL
jgi:hypothetical protein